MDIALWIMWYMVVHDEIDIVHIESSTRYICTDKYPYMPFLKVLQRSHTISLLHITMDIGCREPVSIEIALELLSLMFLRGEDHDLIIRKSLKDTLQNWILISDTHTHEYVIDRIDGRCFREDERLDFSLDMSVEHSSDLLGIGSWERDYLLQRLHRFPDLSHSRSESHIHHLIDLIEDKCRDRVQIDPSTLHEIHETTWSRYDDLGTSTKCLFLFPDRRSTIDGERSHTHMAREIEYFIASLTCEFTSGLEDEDLWNSIFSIDSIERWYHECCGLTWSSLRLDDDILAGESYRYDSCLDFCRLMIAKVSKCLKDLRTQRKGRKRHRKMDKSAKRHREEWIKYNIFLYDEWRFTIDMLSIYSRKTDSK
jgi:hypothetical protein